MASPYFLALSKMANATSHRANSSRAILAISAIENGSDGTKLGTLLTLIAKLDLDIQILPRQSKPLNIEDVF